MNVTTKFILIVHDPKKNNGKREYMNISKGLVKSIHEATRFPNETAAVESIHTISFLYDHKTTFAIQKIFHL